MKKVIFLFAMVLAVSFAMAQKTTTLVQSGVNNVATVDQMACMSGDDNFIIATQSGNNNELTTVQKGWNNDIDLMQSGNGNSADMTQETCDFGEFHGLNTANIIQKGNNNKADLSQMETEGNSNDGLYTDWTFPYIHSTPELDRSINKATTTQSGNANGYTLNQGREAHIPDNESYLAQSGKRNTADIDQLGFTNYSEVRQSGVLNEATLDQVGPYLFTAGSMDESKSWQTGVSNDLKIKQTGEVDEQLAISVQNGSSNTTTILQVGFTVQNVSASQAGSADVIDVVQIDEEL